MVSLALVRKNLIDTERHMDRMRQTGEDLERPDAYSQLVYNRERLGRIEHDLRSTMALSGLGLSKIVLSPSDGGVPIATKSGKTYTWVNPSTGEIFSGLTKDQLSAYKLQYKYQQQALKTQQKAADKAAKDAAKAAKQQAALDAKAAKQQAALDAKAADRAFKLELEKAKYAAKYGNIMTDQDLDSYFQNMYQSMPYGVSDMYSADPGLLPVGYDVYGSSNPSYQDVAPMTMIYEAAPVYSDYGVQDDYGYDDGGLLPQAQLPQVEEYVDNLDDNSAFYETDSDGAFTTLMGGIGDALELPRQAPVMRPSATTPRAVVTKAGNGAALVLMGAGLVFMLAVSSGKHAGKRRR